MPASFDRDILKKSIDRIAQQVGGPTFEPHVTILAGENELTYAALSAVVRNVVITPLLPITVETAGIATSKDYHKDLFITFADETPFLKISRRFAAALQNTSFQLNPHVSLMYRTMDNGAKEGLAATVPVPSKLTFERIALVTPGIGQINWDRVEAWQIELI
jgi:hypothetical protein